MIIKFDIKFNYADETKRKERILNEKKNQEEPIPSDAVVALKAYDKIIQHRHNFSKLLDIKEYDQEKDLYKKHGAPLSVYDKLNVDALSLSPLTLIKPYTAEANTIFSKKFNKDEKPLKFENMCESVNNLFTNKKTISLNQKNGYYYNPNGKIYQSEKHKLIRKNLTFSYDKIKEKFMRVSEDKKYPRSYLPEPGFGLLENPFLSLKKKKKKKTSIK